VTARTFHARRGRLSEQRLATLRELGPRFAVPVDDEPVDLADLFGRRAPVVLEIGSGMGDATAEMAAADPGRDYLAVEVHTAGVADLLGRVEAQGLTNVRVATGDAMHLVAAQLPPACLTAVHVFFPDPWPKSRSVGAGNRVWLSDYANLPGPMRDVTGCGLVSVVYRTSDRHFIEVACYGQSTNY